MLQGQVEYFDQLIGERLQVENDKLLGNRVYATDTSVALYQQKLNRIMHPNPPLDIDGQKGEKTVSVLYDFQKKYALPINGQFDDATIEALNINDPSRTFKVSMDTSVRLCGETLLNTFANICSILEQCFRELSKVIESDIMTIRRKLELAIKLQQRAIQTAKTNFSKAFGNRITLIKIHKTVERALEAYFKNKNFNDIINRNIAINNKLKWTERFTKRMQLIQFIPLIVHIFKYEDSPEWHKKMEKIFYSLLDSIMLGVVVRLISIIGLAAGVSAPILAIVGLVITIVGGIILLLLDEHDIFITKYIQDFAYQKVYNIIYL